jgi:hypothetical protein
VKCGECPVSVSVSVRASRNLGPSALRELKRWGRGYGGRPVFSPRLFESFSGREIAAQLTSRDQSGQSGGAGNTSRRCVIDCRPCTPRGPRTAGDMCVSMLSRPCRSLGHQGGCGGWQANRGAMLAARAGRRPGSDSGPDPSGDERQDETRGCGQPVRCGGSSVSLYRPLLPRTRPRVPGSEASPAHQLRLYLATVHPSERSTRPLTQAKGLG